MCAKPRISILARASSSESVGRQNVTARVITSPATTVAMLAMERSNSWTTLVLVTTPTITRRVLVHYLLTYSSWLNQIGNWFVRIQRDVITRGIFTSPKDLDKRSCTTCAGKTRTPYPRSGNAPTRHGA